MEQKMGFEIFDYRTVNRNVLVTPEIRARLYHMKPGQVDARHSHDLGHEIFLILQGRAEFTINNTTRDLESGQMCIARADEIHQVRNLLPDKPTIMYLSVTPHIQPTHTGRTETDEKMPPRFAPNISYDVMSDENNDIARLLEQQIAAAQAVKKAADANLSAQRELGALLQEAHAHEDAETARKARDQMWESFYQLHKRLYELDAIWNDLMPRVATNQE